VTKTKAGAVLAGALAGVAVMGSAATGWAMPTTGPVRELDCGDASLVVQELPGAGNRIWGEDGTRYLVKSFELRIYRGDFATEPDDVTPILERGQTYGNRVGQGEGITCSFRERNPDHNATAFIDITVTAKP
jgi:hypothetical protein